jgi:hypothetical protein
MASLAAGPLEYLLTTHGEDVIDRLEARARQDADFRRLLEAFGDRESRTRFGVASKLSERSRR